MTWTVGGRPLLLSTVAAVLVAACGSTAPTTSSHAATATPDPATPSAVASTPAPGPVAPPPLVGPFAVVYTDTDHSSSTYRVLLIGLDGAVVASATAAMPASQPNQTLTLSPVSAGSTHAYYRDGSTDIHALAPDGTTSLVTTIAAAGSAEMAFAVSPDETRLALALISEGQDPSASSVHTAIEDLTGGGNRTTLYDASGGGVYEWPVSWQGSDVLLGVGGSCGNGGRYNAEGAPQAMPCVTSIHTVTASNGGAVADICEVPNPEPYGENDVRTLEGLPVAAGVACYAYTSQYPQATSTCSLNAVAVTGAVARFDGCAPGANYIAEDSCFLSPDASRMACLTPSSSQVALLTKGGHLRTIGPKAVILGWMDGSHLLIEVDAGHLAVLDVDSGTTTTVAVDGAAHTAMAGVLAG